MLTNPYLTALVVPLVLILCGALAKKLVRGSKWSRKDFFLGVELALAAMAAGLLNFLDLSRAASNGSPRLTPNTVAANGVFVVICFFLFLWILAMHQTWEKQDFAANKQIAWLGLACNFVGVSLFVSFVLLVRGVN